MVLQGLRVSVFLHSVLLLSCNRKASHSHSQPFFISSILAIPKSRPSRSRLSSSRVPTLLRPPSLSSLKSQLCVPLRLAAADRETVSSFLCVLQSSTLVSGLSKFLFQSELSFLLQVNTAFSNLACHSPAASHSHSRPFFISSILAIPKSRPSPLSSLIIPSPDPPPSSPPLKFEVSALRSTPPRRRDRETVSSFLCVLQSSTRVREFVGNIKAPSIFQVKNVGKTIVSTQGTKIASEGLKHRVFEVSLANLQGDEDHTFRKIRLRAEDVQGKNVLTNFWGMDLTTDKLRSLVCSAWLLEIEGMAQERGMQGAVEGCEGVFHTAPVALNVKDPQSKRLITSTHHNLASSGSFFFVDEPTFHTLLDAVHCVLGSQVFDHGYTGKGRRSRVSIDISC
ncbi:hypothetical protein K1719_024304 [Acacia pycnantha]|nr:hypothetical protein K1719_024304 [Acacia pycnantha]